MSHSDESSKPAYLAVLTLGALGVVFGDIGTSPLYAFREAFTVADLEVSETGVLGVLSLILWALVLVVSVKYLSYVMRADNDGEGGILALTSLLIRKSARSRGRLFLIGVGLFGPLCSLVTESSLRPFRFCPLWRVSKSPCHHWVRGCWSSPP